MASQDLLNNREDGKNNPDEKDKEKAEILCKVEYYFGSQALEDLQSSL